MLSSPVLLDTFSLRPSKRTVGVRRSWKDRRHEPSARASSSFFSHASLLLSRSSQSDEWHKGDPSTSNPSPRRPPFLTATRTTATSFPAGTPFRALSAPTPRPRQPPFPSMSGLSQSGQQEHNRLASASILRPTGAVQGVELGGSNAQGELGEIRCAGLNTERV